ncbi:MAG: hemolysin III family protein, partial [Lachnospiraceae bacterium]|nr:hemolysin III family protein [Lachnospiraceae bacterium]
MQITIREPGSAITHFIGLIMAMLASLPLLVKASGATDRLVPQALSVFMFTMFLLYGASTAYHSLAASERIIKLFKKIDHMMIFALIAGSYTPICLTVLRGPVGTQLLFVIWGIALAGMTVKILWVTCPKWFSSIIY